MPRIFLWLPQCVFLIIVVPAVTGATTGTEWIAVRAAAVLSTAAEPRWPGASRVFGPRKAFAVYTRPVSLPGVQWQRNFSYRALGLDPDLEKSWGLHNFGQAVDGEPAGIPFADAQGLRAGSVFSGTATTVVAVIDSGTDTAHEDLRAALWTNPGEIPSNGLDDDGNGFADDLHGWNFVSGNANVNDDNHHGTFCAGIIAAQSSNGKGSRGVAPGVKILTLKALDSQGFGSTESTVRAIEYAVAQGARVINASWGGSQYDPALYQAVRWALASGVVFVTAAGNDYKNNDTSESPVYPGAFRLPGQISVAAYNNRDEKADFSNFGKETTHLAAPGVAVFSTMPGNAYKFGSGTSFAAPFVAGAAALVIGFTAQSDPLWVKERLLRSTEPLGYYEKDKLSSGGRLAIYNALRGIEPARPDGPGEWSTSAESAATPHPYASDAKEKFLFRVPGAKFVRVHFRGFETESCCDKVTLRDSQQRVVAEYVGSLGDFVSAEAVGEVLEVELASDFSLNKYGFEISAVDFSR